MNILIPMAGRGSRFAEAGYKLPKPLIDVGGKPMIQKVIENIGMSGTYIFIVQKEHCELFDLDKRLQKYAPQSVIIEIEGVTEGAACTCLLARDHIDNHEPLMIANCDQLMKWNRKGFRMMAAEEDTDGIILTFHSTSSKNSYIRMDHHSHIVEVAEKKVISDIATCGVYYWKRGDCFVWCADKMIAHNVRVNNEFYVCPTYQPMIDIGFVVKPYPVMRHFPIGTPEDLECYQKTLTTSI